MHIVLSTNTLGFTLIFLFKLEMSLGCEVWCFIAISEMAHLVLHSFIFHFTSAMLGSDDIC